MSRQAQLKGERGAGAGTYVKTKYTIGVGDRLLRVQKRVLREPLYWRTITHVELWHKRLAGPEVRPAVEGVGPSHHRRQYNQKKQGKVVRSFWYSYGHNLRLVFVWPPPRTPRSHAAQLSSSLWSSKHTSSSVHVGCAVHADAA